ncbi:MAG: zinc metallopeptidase [Spirochaetales bacterium]|nr:zinc metallopeptidase [Leptospiraceae bacterium]MCP5483298.1 zinc metallopeptidase [Spirochaetales bacterium]
MFFGIDPLYLLLVGPTMLLSLWASFRVKNAFGRWQGYQNSQGMTGSQVARRILDRAGLSNVRVERVPGQLTDHYDPRSKTLRLSDATFSDVSIAAAGVAAHEAGHAIQDKVQYPLLGFRSAIVGMASFGSKASWLLIMGGFFLMMFTGSVLGKYVAIAGVLCFTVVVVFQLVTVPVEINASSRAKRILREMQFAGQRETEAVNEVLNAAAWTYVAAALTGVVTLLYFLLRLGLLGRDD